MQVSWEGSLSLAELLRRAGVSFPAPCGGYGRCGKCLVTLTDSSGCRRVPACQTLLTEDAEAEIPEYGGSPVDWNDSAAAAFPAVSDHASVPEREGLGVAADLGTTTLALRLYDLKSGTLLGEAGAWNDQKSCGADVISRIQYSREQPEGLAFLCNTLRGQLEGMLDRLLQDIGRKPSDIRNIYVCGNTVMEHLFAGLSPESIGLAPYRPLSLFEKGEAVLLPSGDWIPAPCVSGYVGGDISCGLLASGLWEKPGRALFLDVGTNGEMALGGRDGFVSCAVACGPAFEGAGIACGMPAAEGAIHRAKLENGKLCLEVLGGGEPRGICGSGLLDLCACLLETGLLDRRGRLKTPDRRYPLNTDGSVYLCQKDIRQLQLAKAAVAAGIRLLLAEEGLTEEDVEGLYLAGGFGNRLDPASAAAVGMLPRILAERALPLGNAALAGASACLLQPELRRELLNVQKHCRYIELSGDSRFSELFIEELEF